MKITVDLPDALYRRAETRAAERGTTLRALLVESLEVYLLEPAAPGPEVPQRDRIRTDERGWPILQRPAGDTRVITDDFIDQLREEEGVCSAWRSARASTSPPRTPAFTTKPSLAARTSCT